MTTKLSLAAAALLLALAGCSAAEDAANDAADAAADRAKQEATNVLRDAIQGQVCTLVGDNRLTDTELTTIDQLLDQADAAGLDSEALQPMRDVVEAGEAKAADIQELQESCP
jgi:protein involved in sex pheromone biosynthesis